MSIPFIDLKRQYQENKAAIDNRILKVLDHGQYIMGPEVNELEDSLARYVGVKHVLACSSGTDALVLPLMLEKLSRSDAVFTTPFTFFASAEAITLAGGTPVFVDIDPDTYTMTAAELERQIVKIQDEGKLNPRGVMPVDLFGLSADYDAILPVAEKYGLFVLEDAAQAFAADYKEKKTCSFGKAAATSFYPAKPLGCYGDGGAVFTDDSELYENLVSLRVHGQGVSGDKYDNIQIGMNARMDTIQAAVLLEKIKLYDAELTARRDIADRYTGLLGDVLKTPKIPQDYQSVWAQYSVQSDKREDIREALRKAGIPSAVFYPTPIHLSKAYRHLGYQVGDFPVSEAASHQIFSLPMHPYLDGKQIERIAEIVTQSIVG